jgi:cellobiose phosphorylase
LQREGNNLRIAPCVPKDWPEYEVNYRIGKTIYHLRVENPQGATNGVIKLTLDGKLLKDEKIVLEDDGREHNAVVTLGQAHGTRLKERDAH